MVRGWLRRVVPVNNRDSIFRYLVALAVFLILTLSRVLIEHVVNHRLDLWFMAAFTFVAVIVSMYVGKWAVKRRARSGPESGGDE